MDRGFMRYMQCILGHYFLSLLTVEDCNLKDRKLIKYKTIERLSTDVQFVKETQVFSANVHSALLPGNKTLRFAQHHISYFI